MSFIDERIAMDGLTFDDVLLIPAYSQVLPKEVSLSGRFSRNISLNIPIVSAAMDTVTEAPMAIALAREGGIGVIHKNMSIAEQAAEVRKVKRAENGMIMDPITIHKDQTVGDALELMHENHIGGIPVVDDEDMLVGIVTNRDVRFQTDVNVKIEEAMTSKGLVTILDNQTDREYVKKVLQEHKVEKLPVVNSKGKIVGLITYKDITKEKLHPFACKDSNGRLRVAAGIGITSDALDRAKTYRIWNGTFQGDTLAYLLALEDRKSGAVRAATIQARPEWQNRALPVLLALPLLRAMGERPLECGVIAEDNLASRLTVTRAGAREKAVFCQYHKELTEF